MTHTGVEEVVSEILLKIYLLFCLILNSILVFLQHGKENK